MIEPIEQVLPKIVEVANQKGDGEFVIRINVKRSTSAVPVSVATFKSGSTSHLNAIESWLPRLVGGGEYMVVVNHENEPGRRFPFMVNLNGLPLPQVNVAATQVNDWAGPPNLVSPNPAAMAADAQAAAQQVQAPAMFPALPQLRPALGVPTYATQQNAPAPQVQTPAIPVTAATVQVAGSLPPGAADGYFAVQRAEQAARDSIAAQQRDLDQRIAADNARREAADREARLKAELDAKLKAIEHAHAQRPVIEAPKGPDTMTVVAAIMGALAPIAQSIIASNGEAQRSQREMQQRQAEMQQKMQQEAAAQQQAMQLQMQTLMLKMMEKPSGTPPEMQAVFDMARMNAESQGAMMSQLVNATGMVSKMSIGMIETIADMTAPPEGSPVLDAVKEGVKALSALSNGASAGARKAIEQQSAVARAQALPQGQRQPSPEQLAAARQRAEQVNAQAQAEQIAHAHAQQAAQAAQAAQQANVVQFPPSQAVIEQKAEKVVNAAFGDLPDGFADVQTRDVVQELEDLIRARHEPVEAVASFMLDSLPTPEMQGALAKVGGDPSELLAKRMGTVWLLANQDYVATLVEAIERQGIERGIFEDNDEDGDEDEDNEEAGAS